MGQPNPLTTLGCLGPTKLTDCISTDYEFTARADFFLHRKQADTQTNSQTQRKAVPSSRLSPTSATIPKYRVPTKEVIYSMHRIYNLLGSHSHSALACRERSMKYAMSSTHAEIGDVERGECSRVKRSRRRQVHSEAGEDAVR